MNVDEDDDVVPEMSEPSYQPAARVAQPRVDRLLRDRLHVHHLVHRDAHDVGAVLGEDDRAARVADRRMAARQATSSPADTG